MRPNLRPSSRALAIFSVCAVSIPLAGCGADEHPPLAALETCQAGWQPLTEPRRFLGPRQLVLHDGELIYQADVLPAAGPSIPKIEAQPLAGGAPRVVAEDVTAWTLWVEGDRVVFAQAGTLRQVPVAGGSPPVVLGDVSPPLSQMRREIFGHALSSTELIWWELATASDGMTRAEFWAMPRSGGAPRLLGSTDRDDFYEQMQLFGQTVILGDQGSGGVVVPLDGGPLRKLDAPGTRLAGVEAEGVYGYTAKQPYDPDFERFEVRLAPTDGGPSRPFWPDLPPEVLPDRLWADGDGGWLASALETFDDGLVHRSVFVIDGAGKATRVACDASRTNEDLATVRPAFTPDSAYLVYEELSDVKEATWRIVKIPRR